LTFAIIQRFYILSLSLSHGSIKVISSWAHVVEPSKLKSKCPSSSTTHRETARKGQGKDPRKASAQSSLKKSTLKSSANIRELETDRVFQQDLCKDSWTPSLDRVYGIKSFANDMSMKELLKRCSPDHVEEKDYPDRSNMKKKGQLPPAKSTKASRMYVEAIHPPENLENKSQFKMQKFLKIESKVKNLFRQ